MRRKETGIDQGMLKVVCSIPVYALLEFHFEIRQNAHAYGEMKLILGEGEEMEYLLSRIHGESIQVVQVREDESTETPIFAGLILTCEIVQEGGLRTAVIRAVSGSYLLDVKKKNRSFQEVGLSYEELIKKVLEDTEQAALLYSAEKGSLEKPVIQYEETDFSFLKRMASHQHVCIYPDVRKPLPRIYYDLQEGKDRGEIEPASFKTGIQSFGQTRGQMVAGISKEYLRYYEIKSSADYSIGDKIRIQGRAYRICEKTGALEKGLLLFTYTIADKHFLWQEKKYHQKIHGASLAGTVLERRGELVKLHLDVDERQEKEKAFFFPWKPESGNLMYCMPEIGTKAYLYIGNLEEGDALALSSVRRNGAVCPDTQDTSKRFLSNEHGKRMKLHPELLEFQGKRQTGGQSVFRLLDGEGILFQSDQEIKIQAEGEVQFSGKQVVVNAPEELTAIRRDYVSPTILDICQVIDLLGKKGKVTSGEKQNIQPAISGESRETYEIDGIEEQILASFPQEDGGTEEGSGRELSAVLEGSMMYQMYGRR